MLMRMIEAWHATSPLRRLAIGTLILVVLAQVIAMAMVAQSQVRNAQAFYAGLNAQPEGQPSIRQYARQQRSAATSVMARAGRSTAVVADPAARLAAMSASSAGEAEPGSSLVNPAYAVSR